MEKSVCHPFRENPGVDQMSSYGSAQAARNLTNSVIDNPAAQREISEWLAAGGQQPLRLDSPELGMSFSRPTGSTVLRGNTDTVSANGVRVILARDLNSAEGFRIVTSFPRRF